MGNLSWTKDRSRQLTKRAVTEEVEEKMKEASTRRRRNVSPPPLSKAALRALGEECVRQHDKARSERRIPKMR
jgi:hypothetical protein